MLSCLLVFYGGKAVPLAVNPLWTEVKIKVVVTERIGDCSQRQVVEFVISCNELALWERSIEDQ